MGRFVALLRGINVGGNKLVPMARLRALLEGHGYGGVATLLQSGNVVLDAKERSGTKLAARLEALIAGDFGFDVPVVVRTRDELAAVVADNPLGGAEEAPSRFLVTFLSAPAKVTLDPAAYAPDVFALAGREIYARFPDGIRDSRLATALLAGKLGVTATARNWATVTKLLALADRRD